MSVQYVAESPENHLRQKTAGRQSKYFTFLVILSNVLTQSHTYMIILQVLKAIFEGR